MRVLPAASSSWRRLGLDQGRLPGCETRVAVLELELRGDEADRHDHP